MIADLNVADSLKISKKFLIEKIKFYFNLGI